MTLTVQAPDPAAPNLVGARPPARRIKVMLAIAGMGIGGAEMVVRDLARSLDGDAFDVCVCCTKALGSIGQELVNEGIDTFVLPGQQNGRVDYLSSVKFGQALRERQIDIVHTHGMTALLDAGVCKATMPGLKVVHTFHYGNYPYDSWRDHLMEGFCARLADRLIAVGWEQRRQILATYRIRDSRVAVIWNGITTTQPSAAGSFRSELGTGNRLLVGTIAKLIPQKGLDDLLTVARRCRDAGHNMQFVIVGEGPLRPMLEAKRRELGLDDTVAITGWLPNAAVRALPAFDVFLQTSRWEAMSIAILEAMANGKAIVATRVGDNPHVIEDRVSGLLANAGDIDGIVGALASTTDPERRRQLGSTARAKFADKFTLEHMIRGYATVYDELARR